MLDAHFIPSVNGSEEIPDQKEWRFSSLEEDPETLLLERPAIQSRRPILEVISRSAATFQAFIGRPSGDRVTPLGRHQEVEKAADSACSALKNGPMKVASLSTKDLDKRFGISNGGSGTRFTIGSSLTLVQSTLR